VGLDCTPTMCSETYKIVDKIVFHTKSELQHIWNGLVDERQLDDKKSAFTNGYWLLIGHILPNAAAADMMT
jgi:hypothetical protein